jgi:hypothetical protein
MGKGHAREVMKELVRPIRDDAEFYLAMNNEFDSIFYCGKINDKQLIKKTIKAKKLTDSHFNPIYSETEKRKGSRIIKYVYLQAVDIPDGSQIQSITHNEVQINFTISLIIIENKQVNYIDRIIPVFFGQHALARYFERECLKKNYTKNYVKKIIGKLFWNSAYIYTQIHKHNPPQMIIPIGNGLFLGKSIKFSSHQNELLGENSLMCKRKPSDIVRSTAYFSTSTLLFRTFIGQKEIIQKQDNTRIMIENLLEKYSKDIINTVINTFLNDNVLSMDEIFAEFDRLTELNNDYYKLLTKQ